MSRFQKSSLAFLAVATTGVFLFVGWLAFGDGFTTNADDADASGNRGDVTIWAVGDSLMVAATDTLKIESPRIIIDAEVGRRMDQGIDVLAAMLETGSPDVLIVALGTNNGVASEQIDVLMDLAADIDKVVFVNVSVPRPWENDTNAAIGSTPDDYPGATLIDWKSASGDNRALFRSDGVHLTQQGTELWVTLILAEATR
jgi:lysophospholipase L1-like esterase